MSITLKKLLKLDVFKDAKIITKIPGQESIKVDSISVMEYPIGNFVNTYEIVLSTGIFCHEELIFREFIEDIIKMDGSALILATGHYIDDIPEKIIELAEKNKLAIITVPWEIKFSDIVKQTYNLLDKVKINEIDKFINIKDRLILMFIEKEPFENILNYISRKLNFELQIADTNNNILAASENYIFVENSKHKYKFKINHDTITYAYLYIIDTKNIIRPRKNFYIENINLNIINPLILWFEREQTIHEFEIHNKEKFIFDIIDNKFINFEEAVKEGKLYGFDLEKNFIALVSKVDFLAKSKTYENSIKFLKDSSIQLAKKSSRQCLVAYRNTFLIILLEQNDETVEDAKLYIKKFEAIINEEISNITFYWGIGDIYDNPNSIYFSYKDAVFNLKHSLIYKNEHISTVNTTREFKIFTEFNKHKKIVEIAKDVLSDLLDESNKELLESLECYYINDRNISKTAKDLFLHRQSLNYRLKKIERITNLNLSNPNDIFLLEFCLKLYKFNKFIEG